MIRALLGMGCAVVLFFGQVSMSEIDGAGGDYDRMQNSGGYNFSLQGRSRMNTPMSEKELSCILGKIQSPPPQPSTTASAMFEALSKLNLPRDRFTRTSLLHFIAEIKAESGAGRYLVQLGNPPPGKTGYGHLQVTGFDNLRAAEKCMNDAQPGFGNGVSTNPRGTLGRDPKKAMMASLCWWKTNIVNNLKHASISMGTGSDDAQKIHQIVNTGRIGGRVTGGSAAEAQRKQIFQMVLNGDRQCAMGSNLVSML